LALSEAVCIDKVVIGTEKHLVVSKGFSWVDDVPIDSWHFNGKLKNTINCFDTLLRLNNKNVEAGPPHQYQHMMESLVSGSVVFPWQQIMSKSAHRSFVQTLVNSLIEVLPCLEKSYYQRVWVPGTSVFNRLERAAIDNQRWQTLVDENRGNVSALLSFRPLDDGMAKPVVYNRFGTRTGRPTIESGPNILVLNKEFRNVITSRYGTDGKIVMFDFRALEVRVILYEAGHNCDELDLYAFLNKQLFGEKLPRDIVKGAVISDLYGQSRKAIGHRLGIKGRHLDLFIDRIRSHFQTDNLLKQVKQEFIKNGFIHNRYGRHVTIDEPLDHILVNSYVQSTGADVVVLGFKNLLDQISGLKISPLFLLSDAIILDCHVDDYVHLRNLNNLSIDGYVQKWPLELSDICAVHESSVQYNSSHDNKAIT
jgi:hypothetical protein